VQRVVRDEHDPVVRAEVDDVFVCALGEVVLVLDGGDGDDQADAGGDGLANERDVLAGIREAIRPEPDPGKQRLTERDPGLNDGYLRGASSPAPVRTGSVRSPI
jgi:hypothetical protein